MDIATWVSTLLASIGIALSIVQTVRLQNLRRYRDQQLRDIWVKQEALSGMLLGNEEQKYRREACGRKSQDLEHDTTRLIASLSGWRRSDLDRLSNSEEIDKFERADLKRILEK
jgi:hypothetical protein